MNLTPEQMRRLDAATTHVFGLPSLLLMEHASLAIARQAMEMVGPNDRVVAFCGAGHNGGDAAAAARHLANRGFHVELVFVGRQPAPEDPGDHAVNFRAAKLFGIPHVQLDDPDVVADRARGADLWIDGLVGTGLTGRLRAPLEAVIGRLAQLHGRSLAVDIPSGLSGLTGEPLPVAIPAEVTVTLGFPKTGFATPAAKEVLGRVVVADIGYPRAIKEQPMRYACDSLDGHHGALGNEGE